MKRKGIHLNCTQWEKHPTCDMGNFRKFKMEYLRFIVRIIPQAIHQKVLNFTIC